MKQSLYDYCTNNNRQYLLDEWDYESNNAIGLFVDKISYGSGKKACWKCEKGHRWETTVGHRTTRNSYCPYCHNKRILPGYNDLYFKRPDLMKEWDYNRNDIDPKKVSVGSPKKAYWICSKGHSYKTSICNKTHGAGCPICMRTRSTSFPEQAIFYYVKKAFPDAINRYKDIFKNSMELDVYIPCLKVGIEYDGKNWHKTEEEHKREVKKYKICKENNIHLIRIKEKTTNIWHDTADSVYVMEKPKDRVFLGRYIHYILSLIDVNVMGNTKPWYDKVNVNIERDKSEIYSYLSDVSDSIAVLHPELVTEWNYEKNGYLKPEMFSEYSGEKVWWKCSKCGYEWQSIIASRAKGHGCDICANKKRKETKKETLLSKRKVLSNEKCLLDWDYDTNKHNPSYYTKGSGEKVNWKCHVCGFKWKAVICDRTRDYKNGCPSCSGKTIVSGINDLFSKRPDLIKEYDFEHNVGIDYKKLGIGSHLGVYWKCAKCGYSYKSRIDNKTHGKGCPCCAGRVVVKGINDLETTNPEIAKDWHPTLNGNLKPNQVTKGQRLKIWWKCQKCGNEWADTLNHRSSSRRECPECKKLKRLE